MGLDRCPRLHYHTDTLIWAGILGVVKWFLKIWGFRVGRVGNLGFRA